MTKWAKVFGVIFGFSVLGGIAIVVLRWTSQATQRQELAAAPTATARAEVPAEESARLEQEPEGGVKSSPRRSVRDYLADYYGAEWVSIRAQLELKRGELLDRPLDESASIASWAESEEDARSRIVLSSEKCVAYAKTEIDLDPTAYESWDRIRRRFPGVPENVGPRELEALRDVVRPFEERVLELGVQRAAILADIQTMKWQSGHFRRAPFVLPDQALESGRRCVFTAAGHSSSGWAVQLDVYEDELPPEYFQYWKDIGSAKQDSLKAARDYIASL